MQEKTCYCCGLLKPMDEFYKHPKMADGHLNKCKTCQKENSLAAKRRDPERYRAISRKYANKDSVKQAVRIKRNSPEGIKSALEAHNKYEERYPLKTIAHKLVKSCIRSGVMIRPSVCSVCANECKPHAHHDNYNFPFVVRWLCDRCHKDWHIENKAIS